MMNFINDGSYSNEELEKSNINEKEYKYEPFIKYTIPTHVTSLDEHCFDGLYAILKEEYEGRYVSE